MIVKNEAPVLARCLRSVHSVVDEIIIVDTGSVDSTIEVAEGFGPLIIRSGWKDDFSYSRNLSIQEASGEWILWLDADDVAPAESLPVISALKQEQPDKVFGFIVRNEKPGKTGTEFVQARMFPNRPDIYFERRIHEQMMFSALRAGLRLVETKAIIEHHGYADPAAMGRKARSDYHLIIVDGYKTDSGGKDLIDVLKEEFPDILGKVVMICETASDCKVRRDRLAVPCLVKPFSLDDFGEVVKKICAD